MMPSQPTAVLAAVLTLAILPTPVCTLSLFLRTTWLSELPETTWRPWFELIKRGRVEGPTSPYYVSELALQNTACCESHAAGGYHALGCLGPKCSALGLAPNSLLVDDLDRLAEYFPMFDRVWIGTTTSQEWNPTNATSTREYAALQASIGKQFLDRYGDTPNAKFAWYITEEGSVPGVGLDATERATWASFLAETMTALYAVKPMDFLWSPSNGDTTPTPAERSSEVDGLSDLFCNLPHPVRVDFQDWLGQSVTFEFPFSYNYTSAFTCEKDTVPTVNAFRQVMQRCPDKLLDVKVNAELFAERLNDGERGEDNGANIVNGDPHEINSRLQCYKTHGLDVGCSWAIAHWYALWTYANSTVYHPY